VRLTPAVFLSLLLVGCSAGTPKPQPTVTLTPSISGVQVYKGLSHRHLQKGEYPQDYPQSPPVGGPHSPVWLKCEVYDQQVPKENAVHSLEHGGVWITYRPELKTEQISTITALAQTNNEYVLISPYSGQDAPVIVTTWGLQLKLQTPDDPRLLEFIRTYAGGNQGDEKGVGCAKTGATLKEALEYDAAQR
jgi:hypothetical protein